MERRSPIPFGMQISEMAQRIASKISGTIDLELLAQDRNYLVFLRQNFLNDTLIHACKEIDGDDLIVQIYFQITPDATPQLDLDEFCAGSCIENTGKWQVCEHNLSYIREFRQDNIFFKWWYYEPIRMGIGGWTRGYYDPYLKMDVVTYSMPVYGESRTLLGVLGIDVDYGDFKKIMQKRLVDNIKKDIETMKREHELIGEKNPLHHQYIDVNTYEIISGNDVFEGLTARTPEMEKVRDLALKAAISDANVLLQGETGVGKDFIAKFIHKKSKFSNGPLINVNCCALPETLMESEFFGYGKGAFTGAKAEGKAGYFEAANGGSIVLNEIGDLPMHLQAKLLNVIQEKEVIRIGETKRRTVNFRLIAATNKDLLSLIATKEFREDLYYRLHVIPIYIPPLRQRKEDIYALLQHFLLKNIEKYGVKKTFSGEVEQILTEFQWPGNIRELENVVERLVVTSNDFVIGKENLPLEFLEKAPKVESREEELPQGLKEKPANSLKKVICDSEALLIREKYRELGSSYKVAKALGISQSQAYKKIKKYCGS